MKNVALIILDGFGIGKDEEDNAVYMAHTPTIDMLEKNCSHARLLTSGEDVGLPAGQMGNSEVGHLNIGAGRIIYQDLLRINNAIKDESFYRVEELCSACDVAAKNNSTLHLMGLVSKGGVHSHMNHLKVLVKLAKGRGVRGLIVHAITDGRDVSPHAAKDDLKELSDFLTAEGIGKIGTVIGRYYAMDRDKRWERIKLAYDLYTKCEGEKFDSAVDAVEASYKNEITDEFIKPSLIEREPIKDGDSLIFFNFRPDRAREIIHAFLDEDFKGFERDVRPKICITTMTSYDKTIDAPVAFKEKVPEETLGEVVSEKGLLQLRCAETEKYAHVTFFFNGGREEPFKGEDRILVPSPKVATYDLKPEMSAYEVTEKVRLKILERKYSLIILNFANTDMVGHTGSLPAAIKAVEAVDKCLGEVLNAIEEVGGAALITADHGNCEDMIDDNGSPLTSHTTNPVPIYLFGDDRKIKNGRLEDIAPTILQLLDIEKPELMTGKSLIGG